MGQFGLFYYGTTVEVRLIRHKRTHPIVTVLFGPDRRSDILSTVQKAVKKSKGKFTKSGRDVVTSLDTVRLLEYIGSCEAAAVCWRGFLKEC